MARLTAPLFSLDASGTIGKAITFSRWKGINYARTRVIPENPKTDDQKEVRGVFSTLSEMWKRMPLLARAPWTAAIEGLPLTDRNKHVQANAAALKAQAALTNLVMSVSGGNAVPPLNVVATPGVLQATITADTPTLPPGYTLTSIVAAVVKDGDPSPKLTVDTLAGEDESTPYSIVITDMEAALYQVGVWCKFLRTSDSKIFYSAAVRKTVTPTAA